MPNLEVSQPRGLELENDAKNTSNEGISSDARSSLQKNSELFTVGMSNLVEFVEWWQNGLLNRDLGAFCGFFLGNSKKQSSLKI